MEDELIEPNDYKVLEGKVVMCRFNWKTKLWQPLEERDGEIEMFRFDEESDPVFAILGQGPAGGGTFKYVFVCVVVV